MSNSIRLSKKYGFNPSLATCFWCGQEKNELILYGKIGKGKEDIEAPKKSVLDYGPCLECRKLWRLGVAVIEVASDPICESQKEIQNGIYPTGKWCVMKEEAAERIFGENAIENKILLVDNQIFNTLGLDQLK